MKPKTISETSIFKSNRSLATTIPSTIKNLEDLSNNKNIRWYYEIRNNKHIYTLEFIEKPTETNKPQTTKKTTSNIHKTTQKQQKKKKRISHKDDEPDDPTSYQETFDEMFDDETNQLIKEYNTNNITSLGFQIKPNETPETQQEKYNQLKNFDKHKKENKDRTFLITIHKDKKFKLNFKRNYDKQKLCVLTYGDGSLYESYQKLQELSKMNQQEIIQFLLEENPKSRKNLEKYNLIKNSQKNQISL